MIRSPIVVGLVLLSSVAPAALQPPETRTDPQGRPIISVHADLVVLHVTVLDRKKGYIAGLPQDAFTVYEDGRPQPVSFFKNEDTPVTVGLVIDSSGSMQTKREGVIAAGLAFARSSNPDDEMFTVNFNEFVSMGLPNGIAFTSDITALHTALGRIGANGRTAIYDAIAFALDHLDGGTRQKRVLIVVSDGADNASRVTFDAVMAQAQASNAVIYTVGLFDRYDRDANPKVLKTLASSTGGQAFFPDDPSDVRQVLERIATDIRSGYTIGYTPTNSERDGTYRRIKVLVRAPGHGAVTVHSRPGYQAPAAGTERFQP